MPIMEQITIAIIVGTSTYRIALATTLISISEILRPAIISWSKEKFLPQMEHIKVTISRTATIVCFLWSSNIQVTK